MLHEAELWNRNIHYHSLLLALGPVERVLDVGCGGGLLSRQFAEHSAHVVGIDRDAASIREAQRATSQTNVAYVLGDVLTHKAPIVWPPPLTDREIKSVASTTLPGALVRRYIHGRHSIVWTKSADSRTGCASTA